MVTWQIIPDVKRVPSSWRPPEFNIASSWQAACETASTAPEIRVDEDAGRAAREARAAQARAALVKRYRHYRPVDTGRFIRHLASEPND